jgi:hypothetical protein
MDDNSDQTKRNQLIDQISAEVVAKILVRVAKDLTDQDVDELEKLGNEDQSGKKVLHYLYEKIPHLESIIFEEMQEINKPNT